MIRAFPYLMWLLVMLPFSYFLAALHEPFARQFWSLLGIYP